MPGYYGAACQSCPAQCGNGSCSDGLKGTGLCVCHPGWSGALCDHCAPGYFGSSCSACPWTGTSGGPRFCNETGLCSDGLSGTGLCACGLGFQGAACEQCAPGFGSASGAIANAATDFLPAVDPNGAWSYGLAATRTSPFQLSTTPYNDGAGIVGWANADGGGSVVLSNASGAVLHPGGSATIQPGELWVHPGAQGQVAVVRWTAPNTGVFTITATFEGASGYGGTPVTTTDIAVLASGAQVFAGVVNLLYDNWVWGNLTTFTATRGFQAGDTLDFVVGYGNATWAYDSTRLDAVVTSLLTCPACAAGSSAPGGQNACTPCAPGTYSSAVAAACTLCPANTFAATGGATSCDPCPLGTWSTAGQNACTDCPGGSATTDAGAGCTQCEAGTFFDGSQASGCAACAAGTFATAGQNACTVCPVGTWSAANAGGCTPCLAGTTAPSPGSASCSSCSAGTYAPSGSIACAECSSGTSSLAEATLCTSCAAGSAASSPGSASCATCQAGTYSGTQAVSCLPCLAGTYSGTGAASCVTCAACTDGDPCTIDGCDTALGCTFVPIAGCSDAGTPDAGVDDDASPPSDAATEQAPAEDAAADVSTSNDAAVGDAAVGDDAAGNDEALSDSPDDALVDNDARTDAEVEQDGSPRDAWIGPDAPDVESDASGGRGPADGSSPGGCGCVVGARGRESDVGCALFLAGLVLARRLRGFRRSAQRARMCTCRLGHASSTRAQHRRVSGPLAAGGAPMRPRLDRDFSQACARSWLPIPGAFGVGHHIT